MSEPLTYAAAGVDTEAGDKAVELMKDAVRRTHGPAVVGGVGGFAGLYDLSAFAGYRAPLLAMTTGKLDFTIPGAHGVTGFDPRGASACDFIGLNYYTRWMVNAGADPERAPKAGSTLTGMGWEDYPEGLYRALKLCNEYAKLPDGRHVPVIITENGIDDRTGDRRGAYMVRHLTEAARAMRDGVDLRGYLVRSLLDGFEWTAGYTQRYGLVHVDFADGNRKRTPKSSYRWLQQVLAAR